MCDCDIQKWKTLSSEYLFKRPWLTARKDIVQLPNGNINNEYYVLEYPDWINIIAITEDGRMVLERQYRHALGRVDYEIPAGVVEDGEDPMNAAKRELEEETGYTGGEWTCLMSVSPNPASMSNLSYTFIAKGVRKTTKQHLEATEDISVYLMPEDDVLSMLKRGDFIQALMVAALWRYFAEERRCRITNPAEQKK